MATGITLTVTLLVCISLYWGIRHSLYQEVDAFLAGEVMEFQAILSHVDGDLQDAQRRIRAELGSRQRGDLAFRLLTEQGRVLLTSDAEHTLPDQWSVPADHSSGLIIRTEYSRARREPMRTCSQWITNTDGTNCIAQVTYRLDQVHASLKRFLNTCIVALAAAAVLATIGGRILAFRSLRLVNAMTTSARRISVEDLTERLERSHTNDELDELAATFNDMLARLAKQVDQLRQFTADAAHELRTPLAALRGAAEVVLSSNNSPDEMRAVLADSIDEYDRLARIANSLLLLARADAGQEFIRRAPLPLHTALRDVIDLFTPVAEEQGLSLLLSQCDTAWVDGDDDHLRQTISNLLDNAIKSTPTGGTIRASLAIADDAINLTVSDTGIGIAPHHLPRIFDRFYRVDRARSRETGGAGLGLSICKTIVEAHGGSIRLSSEPDSGTSVSLKIPAIHPPNDIP